ncbi:MAG: 3'-5' exonuclease [Coriobacteriia bacterium]|nr:3'-5' exonuclease [Coriobacteriia bacterium]
MIDLSTLNPQQKKAVETTSGPLLVLAGAGSGKTRVLTYRIAYTLECGICKPWNILAITFTNKAAAEMRERIYGMIGDIARGMWFLTFHSMCVRILRDNAELIGFKKNFTIYDDKDSKRLVKLICNDLCINTKIYSEASIRAKISACKNELVEPEEEVVVDVYKEYQKRLKAANAFDFDDLLLYTYLLFKNHKDILEVYQTRFTHISIDEYQDTNKAQYEIVKMLADKSKNIMVVGDDDQSIYSWRGADIRNILGFEHDYPSAVIIKLEQNYRSTSNILNAANSVISNNKNRKEKNLFTKGDNGKKIGIYVASNERDEGRWIATEIERRKMRGAKLSDIAVFYRTNAQSRVLEDMLIRAGIPYKIVGGLKFFERAEIKDLMAYLTLIINPDDDVSAKRVINVPRRGIGKTTITHIEDISKLENCSFLKACKIAVSEDNIRETTKKSLIEFLQLFEDGLLTDGSLRYKIEEFIKAAGLINSLKDEHTTEADTRIENIDEFFGVCDEFCQTHKVDELLYAAPNGEDEPVRQLRGDNLEDFLEWVRLRTDLDNLVEAQDYVTLMTVHSAKGLEYDYVFVSGLEENVFPHASAYGDFDETEEERRLAYVAITRAKKELLLTCAQLRQLRGVTNANPVSRFIGEIPSEFKESLGVGSLGYSGFAHEKRGDRRGLAGFESKHVDFFDNNKVDIISTTTDFNVGDTVNHKIFGLGKIIKIDGDKLHVTFTESNQTKVLLKNYAPITRVPKP